MWRPHFLFLASRLDARWQEFLGLVTRTRVASAVARELAARIFVFLSPSIIHGNGDFFSVDGGGSCCQLWHTVSEPCQCAHLHLPK